MIYDDNHQQFMDFDGNQRDWLNKSLRIRGLRHNQIYTDKQMDSMKEKGLDPVGINMAYPVINTVVSNLYSNKNSRSFTPIGNADRNLAYTWQALFTAYEKEIDHKVHVMQALESMVSEGIGVFHVDVCDNMFGTTTRYVDYAQLRWQPGHEDLFWEDLDTMVYFRILTVKQALQFAKKKYSEDMDEVAQILAIEGGENSDFYQYIYGEDGYIPAFEGPVENRKVMWLETFHRETKNYEKVLFNDGRSEAIPEVDDDELEEYSDSDDKRNVYSYYLKRSKGNKEYASEKVRNVKELVKDPVKRVIKRVNCGCWDVGTFTLPTTRMPFVPLIYDMIGYPEGIVRHLDPIQKAMNNTLMLMMYNGRMVSTPKIIMDSNTIINERQLMQALSTPYGLIKYKSNSLSDAEKQKPTIAYPSPMGSSFVELLTLLKNQAEYTTGVYSTMQGNPAGAFEANVTNATLNNAASQKLIPIAERIQAAMCKLGQVEMDYMREFMEDDITLAYWESNQEMLSMVAAENTSEMQPSTIGKKVKAPGHNVEVSINKHMDIKGKKFILNDIRTADSKMRVVIHTVPSMDTYREKIASFLSVVVQQAPHLTEIVSPYILRLFESPIAFELGEKLDKIKQMVAEGQQKDIIIQQLKDLVKRSEQRATVAESSERAAEITKQAAVQLGGIKNKFLAIEKDLKASMKAEGAIDQNAIIQRAQEAQASVDQVITQLEEYMSKQAEESKQMVADQSPANTEGMAS